MNNKKEILLGDNPFFGVDNLSQENARKRLERTDSFGKICDIMEFAAHQNVKGLVITTHPQLREFLGYMEDNSNLIKKFEFYPIFPHAQRYVSLSAEKGMIKAMNDILAGGSIQEKFRLITKGSMGLLKKDFKKLLETMIDTELIPLSKVKKNTVFLHDGVTDLAIGLGMKEIINIFINHLKDNYNMEAGLVTKNYAKTILSLEEWNIKLPTIMTSFNPIGYQMNPTKEECETHLGKTRVIAMNTLAAGYVKPNDAFSYIKNLDIDSVVVGMSKKEHIIDTVTKFNEILR